MKNPYRFVEKANNTFNLYLDKFDEIQEYMVSSKKEQVELKNLFKSFLEEYNNHQNKLNDLIANLIEENVANKEAMRNLEIKLNK